jgi:hypothetical protein
LFKVQLIVLVFLLNLAQRKLQPRILYFRKLGAKLRELGFYRIGCPYS